MSNLNTKETGVDTKLKPDAIKRIKSWLRPITVAVALVFVLYAARQLSQNWQSARVVPAALPVSLALMPLLVSVLVQGFGWTALINHLAKVRVPGLPAMALYLDSQIARYAPGKVGLPVVRMAGAAELGVPARQVGISVLIELLAWTALGAAAGLLAIAAYGEGLTALGVLLEDMALPVFGLVALAFLLLLVDRQRLPRAVQRLLGFAGAGPLVPAATLFWQLVYWFCWAAHGCLLTWAFGIEWPRAFSPAGYFMLAPVAGFLALAAPAGIGIREAVLAVGLTPLLGGPGALAAAAVSRAMSLFADVLCWLMVSAIARRKRKKT